jgi:ribosome biogenesis SPOUT family RNA methylase Rps3
MRERLRSLGEVHGQSFRKLFAEEEVVILDPLAKEPLTREDLLEAKAVVVGGILGYEKPRGRTAKYITRGLEYRGRHLGRVQLSIDSAALVAKLIYLGERLENIEITREVEVRLSDEERVILPYGYVVHSGRVMLTPGMVEYLAGETLRHRQREAESRTFAEF